MTDILLGGQIPEGCTEAQGLDHETGRVRGLLCHHCNKALGGFKDSVEILTKAIKYLNPN